MVPFADEKDITLSSGMEINGSLANTIWTCTRRSGGRLRRGAWHIISKRYQEHEACVVEEKYVPISVTILGDDVAPAVKGANIRPLAGLGAEQINELKLRAASYIGKPDDAEQPANEPKKKGVKTKVSIKKMREMQALFPNDRVLSISDDGMNVMLCSKKDGDVRGLLSARRAGCLAGKPLCRSRRQCGDENGQQRRKPLSRWRRRYVAGADFHAERPVGREKNCVSKPSDLKSMQSRRSSAARAAPRKRFCKTFDEINATALPPRRSTTRCKKSSAIDKGE